MIRLLATLLLLGPASLMPAEAHQIESALQYLDGDLQLSSRFSNGEPTQDAVVRLLNPDGSPGQELGRTDASGRLTLDLRRVTDGVVDLQIDGGPGHRDYLEVPVSSGQPVGRAPRQHSRPQTPLRVRALVGQKAGTSAG